MSECPRCEGKGQTFGYACPGFRPMWFPCNHCGGSGQITEQQADWIRRGEAMRLARRERRETLREAADRMGIDYVRLSHMEQGLEEPQP